MDGFIRCASTKKPERCKAQQQSLGLGTVPRHEQHKSHLETHGWHRHTTYAPPGRIEGSYRFHMLDGAALFNIHCTTPVDVYLLRPYASNMALWLSYAAS